MTKPILPSHESIDVTRHSFRKLMAANPNYFGTAPDLGFELVEAKSGDTTYEELQCVSYSAARDRIEATVMVKRPTGYLGGLCTKGSFEHVRFYVDYGTGWQDAGATAINVHDIPVEKDCAGKPTHPLSYVCGVDHKPQRQWCAKPVLPKVRAILSWNLVPPANDPGWTPPWGNVHDCRGQVAPRRFVLSDIAAKLTKDVLALVPPLALEEPPSPVPDPGPMQVMDLEQLVRHYAKEKVPTHRMALEHLTAATEATPDSFSVAEPALVAEKAGIDLSEVIAALQKTSGDTTYEQLECLGLDEAQQSLVATFRLKLAAGYSGPPCSAGSTEFVAFWADWEGTCDMQYMGTVKVNVHDYKDIGKGLCYAAILPVDLGTHRRACKTPVLRKVRAVLSWNVPPSTTDPNAVPHWGNIVDRHVQIAPGRPYDGKARFTIVGGVASQSINLTTGLTEPGAILGTSSGLPDECAFAGLITLQGPNDPALAGHQYRIRATNVDAGGSRLLTTPFWAVTSGGFPVKVTPDPVTGWAAWPTWMTNTEGMLGVDTPGTDDKWDYTLELDVALNVVATARVQIDSTLKNTIDPADTVNAGDLKLSTGGACKVPHAVLNGKFVARDRFFWRWDFEILGGPGGPIPPIPLTATVGHSSQTPFTPGADFTLDFTNPMIAPCGYVVRLSITDRVIVNSAWFGRSTPVDRGICLSDK